MVSFVQDVLKKIVGVLYRFPLVIGASGAIIISTSWIFQYLFVSRWLDEIVSIIIGIVLMAILVDLVSNRSFSMGRIISHFRITDALNALASRVVVFIPFILFAYLTSYIQASYYGYLSHIAVLFMVMSYLLLFLPIYNLSIAAIMEHHLRVDHAIAKSLSIFYNNMLGILVINVFVVIGPSALLYLLLANTYFIFIPQVLFGLFQLLVAAIIYHREYQR